MADEPIAFESTTPNATFRAKFDFGASEGDDSDFACVRCGAPGARLIAAPSVALCLKCARIEAARVLGK